MNLQKAAVTAFWFRRDLRLEDNTGLGEALRSGLPVIPIFIFDQNILSHLEDKDDRRVAFIYQAVVELEKKLSELGSGLVVEVGQPVEVWRRIQQKFSIKSVYANRDYESEADKRDQAVARMLEKSGISFHTHKDQVIFEKAEVAKDDGKPYTVFTPYYRKWVARLDESETPSRMKMDFSRLHRFTSPTLPSLKKLGFQEFKREFPVAKLSRPLLRRYALERDIPSLNATTHLGVHLRFGTISIRDCVRVALQTSEIWLKELIWREFFMQIMWHFPHVTTEPFRPEYAKIRFRYDQTEFSAWCEGRTGYPLVDAGMRELNATGFMHNRVRMITASFLVKHLMIDYRWGEKYFARRLLDFELASNNGNWQWVTGSGCDASPFFRIFNPATQLKKFDPQFHYVRKWVPELGTPLYPQPIVDHVEARTRALYAYQKGLSKKAPSSSRR